MAQFLKQVAEHYFAQGAIEKNCFIFPNRRALVFFKKYLGACVAASGNPVFAPECYTMNDFFYRICKTSSTDRITLLTRLYDCYKPLFEKRSGKSAEPLDDFIFWGDVILSDFNDVDKYLVSPEAIFTNIAQYKEMQSDLSYLTDTQREALESFLGNFRQGADYKTRFQNIWDVLLDLYCDFNVLLESQGLSYEGQVYRRLARKLDTQSVADLVSDCCPRAGRFVFVGLNALNACERKLLAKLRDARLAEFCWDFSSAMIRDPRNKSSLFLSGNIEDFPQAFQLDPEGLPKTKFHVLSVGSSIGQAKQLPQILQRCGSADLRTAIVLPDEKLLIPVLNSIPPEITDLNVTMGYPLSGSELSPLMKDIAALQMHLRLKDGKWYFYHKQVWSIFANGLFKSLISEDAAATVNRIRKEARYYIPVSDFEGDPLLECIFAPVVRDPNSADPDQIAGTMLYQQRVLEALSVKMKEHEDMALELDFAREMYLAIRHLQTEPRALLPATYFRLLQQLTAGSTVPFKGEPLQGLQIMGPLETRALDFENVIILSCNEGIFPRHSSSSSFIPGELRKGFDLPTYEYKDAMWAYYFYRMVQRASNVWMLYDSRTEGVRVGEVSRFVKQLDLHFHQDVEMLYQDTLISVHSDEESVVMGPDDIVALRNHPLSASSLKNYLDCPAKFYYSHIRNLKPDDEVSESLDAGMLGTVFHSAMEALYSKRDTVSAEYIDSLLAEPKKVRDLVKELICSELNAFEVSGRNIIYCDIICSYVGQVLKRDRQLMGECGVKSFKILGLERKCTARIGGLQFVGYIDRLDSFLPDQVRVVDYKTGKVTDKDLDINDDNAETVVEALFGDNNSQRPKIALQLYIYDVFARHMKECSGKQILNSIYQTNTLFVKGVPQVELSQRFCDLMKPRLEALIAEILDPEVEFNRTSDPKTCQWCDFKQICGR